MDDNAPKQRHFETLIQMMSAIPDEQAAIDHFTAIRWKHGAFCPHCGSTKVYHFSDRRTHNCGDCRKRFSIKVGTIFEDSKIGIRHWMLAVWLITSHKKGIASTQLAKDIGVTQKTAWFMLHRLRYAAQTKSFNRPLQGEIEADETFMGGKEKNSLSSVNGYMIMERYRYNNGHLLENSFKVKGCLALNKEPFPKEYIIWDMKEVEKY